jgi:hypothetical protein
MIFRWADTSITKLISQIGSSGTGSSQPVVNTPTKGMGLTRATVFSLDRQVFEPLQEFPTIVRAATIEAAVVGVKWSDLTQPWSTYTQTWESFFSLNQICVFIGVDDGTQTTWADLTGSWASYLQSWNSFPAGGNVESFSDNSTTDAGMPIPYSMVPALLYEDSRQTILLDSWSFYFKIASFFELVTIEFDALAFALDDPTPLTATFSDLSDENTFSVSKALPVGQTKYSRYIKVSFFGNSYYRAFAFGGAAVFVQIQERPSK